MSSSPSKAEDSAAAAAAGQGEEVSYSPLEQEESEGVDREELNEEEEGDTEETEASNKRRRDEAVDTDQDMKVPKLHSGVASNNSTSSFGGANVVTGAEDIKSIVSSATGISSSSSSSSADNNLIYIAPEKVGHIIGSKGMVIQELQMRTGCKLILNQDFPPGVNRTLTFQGTPEQIVAAKKLVLLVLAEGPTAIHPNNQEGAAITTQEINCPQGLVGRIIGTGGATIKDMQTRSGAKIQINQNFPDGVDRKIIVTGNAHAMQMAMLLIANVMEQGPQSLPLMSPGGGAAAGFMGFGGGGMPSSSPMSLVSSGAGQQTLEVAKIHVGKIIGRGGETINMVQAKSGAKVQIDQNTIPCKVLISGNPQVRL